MNTITVTVKAAAPSLETLILKAIRAAQRPLTLAELSETTGRAVDSAYCLLMIEDGFIYPTERDRERASYYIRGEESDPDFY